VSDFDVKVIAQMMQLSMSETEEYISSFNNKLNKLNEVRDTNTNVCDALELEKDEYKTVCDKVKKSVKMFNSILLYATNLEGFIKEMDESKYKDYQDVKSMVDKQKEYIDHLSGNKEKAMETL